jgi:hypothetical protein
MLCIEDSSLIDATSDSWRSLDSRRSPPAAERSSFFQPFSHDPGITFVAPVFPPGRGLRIHDLVLFPLNGVSKIRDKMSL